MATWLKSVAKKLPGLRQYAELRAQLRKLQAENAELIKQIPVNPAAVPVEEMSYRAACHFPPGHYYSAIPSVEEIRRREARLWPERPMPLPAIDLNDDGQLQLIQQLAAYYADQPFDREKKPGLRYWFNNNWFGAGDAIMLQGMMRHFKPKRILEVGSGFSSAVMLDINDRFFHGAIRFTFIEPEPQRLLSLLSEEDKSKQTIIETQLQDIDLGIFQGLEAGDFLFIDTSHVLKTGGEVNRILFELFPSLRRGVYVHIHDIFCDFEYPKQWAFEGWAWNEAYAVRAFLQYNQAFRIRLFNSYLARAFPEPLKQTMPLCLSDPGGGLWLEKVQD